MKKALITGIAGQDGSYLAELLLGKGYEVHGVVRRGAVEDSEHRLWRIRHLLGRVHLHAVSLESYPSVVQLVGTLQPDELYHLAAQSFVSYSFEDEVSALTSNINGIHFVLAAVKAAAPACRVYFASSSEMFGKVREVPQTEQTAFRPRSAYGISKVAGYDLTRNYRETYGLYAVSGILYNHESPRRGYEFVTRKITSHVARIKSGMATELRMGSLDARRDWGHARDYVCGIWLMLQQPEPDDYVLSTGETHSVMEFLDIAFGRVGLDWRRFVVQDTAFVRPAEGALLVGNSQKARSVLGWVPQCGFSQLVEEMVDSDLSLLQ
jgi:GDPmannose 4,6-dehydratase